MTINTVLVVFLVNSEYYEWFIPGGFIDDMFWVIVANAFIMPLIKFFNFGLLVKYFRKRSLRTKAETGEPISES
eukprot:CAMPEP_0201285846 /NCGR_PEP_ID=MMETSP1317-20130820/113910_1 /ASSEMBLY_ACC=CAM_ASM_000770 /TAXON_ID=187299 /ORGANISM="Undescribed Undescribed, Strain Undescribed" /LENGTH=73 /DNA_ID=CAMNT_0047611907 /DNA_START=821 /DNA_END=1042 /DNA_ORIENTATION=-